MLRRTFALLIGLTLAGAAAPPAQAAYPDKPVRIIVAYPAGQGTDLATRYLAERLTQALGQTFYVENRGGAGGNIGTDIAARAEPDGYTLTMGTNATHALNAYLYPEMSFDAARDFAPIALVATFPMVLMTRTDAEFGSLADVLQAAKTRKGAADIGMPSTTARLVLELLKEQTGAPLFGVPYKGSSTAMADVMGKQIALTIDTVGAARPQLAGGKLKALGVTSQQATALLPDVPTLASQGYPEFEVIAWNALYAPRGTPDGVVQRLNQTVNRILQEPQTRDRLLQMGYDRGGGSPKDLADFAQAERDKWAPIIKKAGIKAG